MTTENIARAVPAQPFFRVSGARREKTLEALLGQYLGGATLVLCNMKQSCEIVARNLRNAGWSARALHGNLEQRDREQVLIQFLNGSCNVLVATDVAAEALGEDPSLDLVVSFDLPRNPAIHEARACYAATSGTIASLVASDERQRFDRIADYYAGVSEPVTLPFPENGHEETRFEAPMVTLMIDGGAKDHISGSAVVNVLVEGGVEREQIGRMDVRDFCVYLAVSRDHARRALQSLRTARLHSKTFAARSLSIHQ